MPDWLSNIIPVIITGIIGATVIPLLLSAWQRFLPREKTKLWGLRVGKFISFFMGKKIGRNNWEKLENNLASTIYDFWVSGVIEGLNADDEPEKKDA
uniref:Holin n=1 Tax=viral metagenome TaxID=1070528 RepID=A0A6M3KPX1_9ZZZZ